MDLAAFSRLNRRRCESELGFGHLLNSWSLSDWMTALAGEVGEAANIIKKLNRVRDGMERFNDATEGQLRNKLAKELGDAACYLDLLCQAAGFDLGTLMIVTFNEVSKKYNAPHIFSEED